MTDTETLARVTKEIVADYRKENCRYLELRSTPKVIGEIASKQEYVETVLNALVDAEEENEGIRCGLLVSVYRTSSPEAVTEAVDLILGFRERWSREAATDREKEMLKRLVGIDLSGNPSEGHFDSAFQTEMRKAQDKGIKVALHCAEVIDQTDTQEMIDFRPERLGHCCYLSASQVKQVVEMKIPVEVCPTSNVQATQSRSVGQLPHVLEFAKYPDSNIIVCCDDTLVFQTDITKELYLYAEALGLHDQDALKNLLQSNVDAIFMDDDGFKDELR